MHVFDDTVEIAPFHYAPEHRPLAVIETLAQTHGFGHWCWCSPVYTWQCGVVVIDTSITEQSWLACTAWAYSSGIEGGTEN